MEVNGRVAKTNLVSNTAFRGFGGPQGMLVMEEIIDRVARRCGCLPKLSANGIFTTAQARRIRLTTDRRSVTIASSASGRNLEGERGDRAAPAEIAQWNASSPHRKRGIAMTPVKFGISFTNTILNQAALMWLSTTTAAYR
jgi:xanthine dehydrogenase large subunit